MTLPQPELTEEQQKMLEAVDLTRGDLVKLLSGGPVMTVLDIDVTKDKRAADKVIVTCGFFMYNQNYYVNPFPPEALKLWEGPPNPLDQYNTGLQLPSNQAGVQHG